MNQNKIDSMEAVGELPDYGNLLLQENGFPHVLQSDGWNEAGTKPDHPCLCEIKVGRFNLFQFWDGRIFRGGAVSKREAMERLGFTSIFQDEQWREVQL